MAADKETVKRFLFWLHGNHGQRPDLPTIQKKIADDGIDIHGKFEWNSNLHSLPSGLDAIYEVEGSLLHRAIALRHPAFVRWLIKEGLDVNAPLINTGKRTDGDAPMVQIGWFRTPAPVHTPLSLAALQLASLPTDVPEIVELLLAAGASPNLAVDRDKKNTPLNACVRGFYNHGQIAHIYAAESRKALASLLSAGADPALAMDDLLGELKRRKKIYTDALRKKERVEAKRTLHPSEMIDHGILYRVEAGKERLAEFIEGLDEVLLHQTGQLIFLQQQGRRLFEQGNEAVAKLAQYCDAVEASDLAGLVREGSKSIPDFPAIVELCLNAGMAEMAVSLFAPGKWPDKPDLLRAYDETLSRLQPEHAAFLHSRIDMTPIRRDHTGRHGESWLARYSAGLQEQTPMAEPQR